MILSVRDIPEDLTGVVLRAEDQREIEELGYTLETGIRTSQSWSKEAKAIYVDDVLAAIWGYGTSSPLASTVFAWMVTTPEVEKHMMRFSRSSQRVLADLLDRYSEVRVYVHRHYFKSMKWLKWLGFDYYEVQGTFLEMSVTRESFKWPSYLPQ